MATNYTITLTDQERVFQVAPYTTNGPDNPQTGDLDIRASAADTTLLLYGKGTPEYGERTAENLIHIMENFSSVTEPAYPISGQQWNNRSLSPSQLMTYDMKRHVLQLNLDGDVGGVSWFAVEYNNTEDRDSIMARLLVNFKVRIHNTVTFEHEDYLITTAPSLMIADGNKIKFQVSPTPPASRTGSDWYYGDWGFSLQNDSPLHGDLDAGENPDTPGFGWSVVNLRDPLVDQDAATKIYVDTEILAATGLNNELGELVDVDITTPVTNNILVYDGVTTHWVNAVGDDIFLSLTGGSIVGAVTIDGTITFTAGVSNALDMGTNIIRNVADPIQNQDAATKLYVDDQIGGSSSTLSSLTDTDVNPSTFQYDLFYWDHPSNNWMNIIPDDFITQYALVTTGNGNVASNAAAFISSHNILTTVGGSSLDAPFNVITGYVFNAADLVNKDYVDTEITNSATTNDGVVVAGVYDDNTTPPQITLERQIEGVPGSLPDVVVALDNIKDIQSHTVFHDTINPDSTAYDASAWEKTLFNSATYPTATGRDLFTVTGGLLGMLALPVQRLTFPTNGSGVINLGPGLVTDQCNPVLTSSDMSYAVGHNTMSVHVNGIKQVASTEGTRDVSTVLGSGLWSGVDTGLLETDPNLPIVDVSISPRDFVVAGDQTQLLPNGTTFVVSGSTGNDGTYTIINSVYDAVNTNIYVAETIPLATIPDGNIVANDFTILFANDVAEEFIITGDQTTTFSVGASFTVVGSTGNDGSYTVLSSSFSGNETTIAVNEDIINGTPDGNISVPDLAITNILITPESFGIAGDQTLTFVPGLVFAVINSTGNNGNYTVLESVFGTETTISVLENIGVGTIDGEISITGFAIVASDDTGETFTVVGDQTLTFTGGVPFSIINSTGNNGNYTVSSSLFDSTNTIITVNEDVVSGTTSGTIYLPDFVVTNVTIVPEEFSISGDQTTIFTPGTPFSVIGSTGNNGNYTVLSSSFDTTNTNIVVLEDIQHPVVDGEIVGFGILYTFDISVNGQASVEVGILGTAGSKIGNVIAAINTLADLNYHDSGTPDTTWAFGVTELKGRLSFYSSLPGTGSSIDLTDGITNPLFGSMVGNAATTGSFSIELPLSLGNINPYTTADYSYDEIGRVGRFSQLIQFIGASIPPPDATVEVLITPQLFIDSL